MNIMILEDSPERCEFFRKFLSGHVLYFYDNAEAAKTALRLQEFDMIFLDHDLEGQVYVNSDHENTGYQVAKYIADKNIETQVIIHTMNYSGAGRMLSVLPNSKWVAFNQLLEAHKINR